jgi:transposase InsO family protein
MVLKSKTEKRTRKVALQKASASEIISALGIRRAEERQARAAVATAERLMRHRTPTIKKRVSGKVERMRKTTVAK